MKLAAEIAAVSTRKTQLPRVTGIKPADKARLTSFPEKSPSGPIKTSILDAALGDPVYLLR